MIKFKSIIDNKKILRIDNSKNKLIKYCVLLMIIIVISYILEK